MIFLFSSQAGRPNGQVESSLLTAPDLQLLMHKPTQQTYHVEAEILTRYLNHLFPEITLPPLPELLTLSAHKPHLQGTLLTIEPHHSPSSTSPDSQAICYIHTGVIELRRLNNNRWERHAEYKEGFFCTVNLRQNGSWTVMRVVAKTKAVISVFALRPPYTSEWLAATIYKNQLLCKSFYFGDSGMESQRKKPKFKEFARLFEVETVRRDTRFIQEGLKNQKVYVVSRGEVRLLKQMRVRDQRGLSILKDVTIVYAGEGSVLGAELFLMSSRSIHTVISNHAETRNESIEEDEELRKEEGKREPRRRNTTKSRMGKISVQQGGYELYPPHQNLSNYSIVAQSANLELYSVDIECLIDGISERQKINFTRLLEQTYLTVLRRTHEKLVQESQKENERCNKGSQSINLITSQLYSSPGNQVESEAQTPRIQIKQVEVGRNVEKMGELRRPAIQANQQLSLQRRADLVIKQKAPSTDFRQKIESLLQKQLKQRNAMLHSVQETGIVQDLAQIFRKSNEGRTEDIERHQQLLDKKINLLNLRGGWQKGWAMLKGEAAFLTPKRTEVQNYLRHSSTEHKTFRVKEEYACKIHEANKIKEQFMKIKSECRICSCYDNFERLSHQRGGSSFARTAYRSAEGWGRALWKPEEPPLEKIYNEMRFMSEKSKQKYKHSAHLLKVRSNRDKLERRKSAPML